MEPLGDARRIRYGSDPRQYGDLRVPDGEGPRPVAVVVHGGCWTSIADSHYMERLAARLADRGWATWNLEFRTVDEPGGAWPGIFRDVAAGLEHLRVLTAEVPLDLSRVVTVGHSSGGHLALWLAGRHRLSGDSALSAAGRLPVAGAVSLAGIADLARFDHLTDRGCPPDVVARLLGGPSPERERRLGWSSPAALLPLGVPQLLVTGEDDATVPPDYVEAYARAARESGDVVSHHRIAGAGHFEVVAPWTEPWARVEAVLGAFLRDL